MDILFIIDRIELKYFEFNNLVTNFWLIKEFLLRNNKDTQKDGWFEFDSTCDHHHFKHATKKGRLLSLIPKRTYQNQP